MNYEKYTGIAQALFEESRDALFLLDMRADSVLDANGAAQRLSGFALRDLTALSVASLFQCDDHPGLQPLPPNVRRVHYRYAQCRYRLRCYGGLGWMPVDVTVTKLVVQPDSLALVTVQNARIGAVNRAWDIRRLRRLMGDSAVCLWQAEIAPTGTIDFQYFVPVIKHLSGRPAKYFAKGLESWSEIVHPDDRPLWQSAWKRIWSGESAESEYRIFWPDQSIRWLRESVRAERDPHSKMIALRGLTSNITPFKSAI
jgi:PAS domain-containing protein